MNDFSSLLEKCELCPRCCGVNRLKGERGFCGVGAEPVIAHYGPHFGEEPPISGMRGSGNVFFSSCNLRCVYCQNHQLSHGGAGRPVSVAGLEDIFLSLEDQGVHNVNLVSPTPYVPFVIAAIEGARRRGLSVPFVYNTNAFVSESTLRTIDGLIDIYLPDFKYWHRGTAKKLSDAPTYPEHARRAILEMYRQVGHPVLKEGLMERGLIVRHLVLPGDVAGAGHIIAWIKENLGAGTWLSLMSQYSPLHNAPAYPIMNRMVRDYEYGRLVRLLVENGFQNALIQELDSPSLFVPDFERPEPFA